MGASQFVSLTLRLLHLEGVQDALSDVGVFDGLFQGSTVVIHQHELVPEEVGLSLDVRSEVIVVAEDWAWSENRGIGEGFLDNLLTDGFSLEIE